jgi:DNA-binding NarL/FixJ family response regulator
MVFQANVQYPCVYGTGTFTHSSRVNAMQQNTNILIADDTTLMRRLLAFQLSTESDMKVMGEAKDGKEAVEMALRLRPDVILMDLDMPLLNGLEATERILSQAAHIRIIMLTAHQGMGRLGQMVGAFECLEKDCTPQELLDTIRRARRTPSLKPQAAAGGGAYHDVIARIAIRANLTERATRTLEKAVQTQLTFEQIAYALTEETAEKYTVSAVKHALDRVMAKLHIEPRTRVSLVRYVLELDQTRSEIPA